MILFIVGFMLLVGMVFLMAKSEDFAKAVGAVTGVLVFLMVIALVAASCS